MEVAGLAAFVQPMFFSTREYCRPYLTQREPELFVEVTAEDLIRQQEALDQEADEEGLRRRKFTDPFLERTVIQEKIAGQLLERDTLLLHGSTVAVDGQAYLFTAPCGTGKSTHTRLWRELFGDRAVNNEELFGLLEEEAGMDFRLKEKYARMRRSMYKYIDKNNSKRVCEEIRKRNW